MKWSKVFGKGMAGFIAIALAQLAANPQIFTDLIPEKIANMSIASAVGAVLFALKNYLKHKGDK